MAQISATFGEKGRSEKRLRMRLVWRFLQSRSQDSGDEIALSRAQSTLAFRNRIACPDDAGHRDVTSCKTRGVWMIDKLQPRQIFSLDDQSNNSTRGHQRIMATYNPITIIHENSNIAQEINISSMKTRKSLTLVHSKCDKTVTANAQVFFSHV